MKLKEKILSKSIQLFNEQGIASTSPNQIASELEISPGNLTYHFKTKADLVLSIYELMIEHSQNYIPFEGYLSLNDFRLMITRFQEFVQEYSFFFSDIALIVRNYPDVGKLIEKVNLKRFKEVRMLFEHYRQTERMLPESEVINYDYLTHRLWSIVALWETQNIIIPSKKVLNEEISMVDMAWNMIFTYLTEKGKEEYEQIQKFLKNGTVTRPKIR